MRGEKSPRGPLTPFVPCAAPQFSASSTTILDEEPIVNRGLAAALLLCQNKGEGCEPCGGGRVSHSPGPASCPPAPRSGAVIAASGLSAPCHPIFDGFAHPPLLPPKATTRP